MPATPPSGPGSLDSDASSDSPGANHTASWVHRRRHALALTAIIIACVGVPVALAALTGSLSIPHNDAWSHSRIARDFGLHGTITLVGWNRGALLGQIVPLGPLARWVAAQQLFVALLAAALLVASYFWLQPRVGAPRALFGTATLGLLPMFGLLATSFMADIPAAAAFMACLAVGDRAIRKGSTGLLWLAGALGVWGVTIREQTLAALAAVLLVAFFDRRVRRPTAALVSMICLGAIGAFELWRQSLPLGDHPQVQLSPAAAGQTVLAGGLTLALFLLPVAGLVARPWRWGWPARLVALATTALCAVLVFVARIGYLPNYLAPGGAYASAEHGRQTIFAAPVWNAVLVLTCLSVGLLVGTALQARLHSPGQTAAPRRRRVDPLTAAAAGLLVAGTLGQALIGQEIYDRYLITLVPLLCGPLLGSLAARPAATSAASLQASAAPRAAAPARSSNPSRASVPTTSRWAGAVGLVVVAALSWSVTASTLARDGAQWRAAERLVARGVSATDIDAGFEWLGWHSSRPMATGSGVVGAHGYTSSFADTRACYTVSQSPLPDMAVVETVHYPRFAVAGSSTLWVQRSADC
ncbi:hypothetical protein [Propionibacterium freudenreichii]|uniref:hypothetical protein n=1 Tax=Propionibacterium freudenreichii TaxID=1744 RepID=UPI00254E5174|nr:hypothetical protein [Propionibacterium freudenreichii]MDK9656132.1 glycosyltransferase family 39 protein [Propionibacterium freudenreichii]